MTTLEELEAARETARELQRRIEASPIGEQFRPRIDRIMSSIDEAFDLLQDTPEYQVFRDRVHELSSVLHEADKLLGAQ